MKLNRHVPCKGRRSKGSSANISSYLAVLCLLDKSFIPSLGSSAKSRSRGIQTRTMYWISLEHLPGHHISSPASHPTPHQRRGDYIFRWELMTWMSWLVIPSSVLHDYGLSGHRTWLVVLWLPRLLFLTMAIEKPFKVHVGSTIKRIHGQLINYTFRSGPRKRSFCWWTGMIGEDGVDGGVAKV